MLLTPSFRKILSRFFYGYSVKAECAENLHIIKFSEKKFPSLLQGHLSRKVHGFTENFTEFSQFPPCLFLLNHSNTQVFCALKNFLSVYSAIRTKPVTISKIFPLTFLRTLIPKIQPLRVKFLFFFESRVPFTTTRTKSFESSRVYKKIPEKIFLLYQGQS